MFRTVARMRSGMVLRSLCRAVARVGCRSLRARKKRLGVFMILGPFVQHDLGDGAERRVRAPVREGISAGLPGCQWPARGDRLFFFAQAPRLALQAQALI